MLRDSFPPTDDTGAPQPTSTELTEFRLDTPAVDMRYVKFQINQAHGKQGGLQYFDIVRKPKPVDRLGWLFTGTFLILKVCILLNYLIQNKQRETQTTRGDRLEIVQGT